MVLPFGSIRLPPPPPPLPLLPLPLPLTSTASSTLRVPSEAAAAAAAGGAILRLHFSLKAQGRKRTGSGFTSDGERRESLQKPARARAGGQAVETEPTGQE